MMKSLPEAVRTLLRRASRGPAECALDVSKSPAAHIDRLEERRLLASISGNVFYDADSDRLLDFFETPQEAVTLYLDSNDNGVYDDGEPTTMSNANGNYTFRDLDPGEYIIGMLNFFDEDGDNTLDRDEDDVATERLIAQTSPGVGGANNTASNYNIDIVFTDNGLTTFQRELVTIGINRWSDIIAGDLPDTSVAGYGPVDDIVLFVNTAETDGPGNTLASAGPLTFRPGALNSTPGAGLPSSGIINIDPADIEGTQNFVEVLTHEVGHALGIGTLWDNLVDNLAYFGDIAVEQRNEVFPNDIRQTIEVENRGGPGSFGSHWRESVYGDELMTSVASGEDGQLGGAAVMPLSRMTAGGVADLGYVVNYANVDPFGPFDIGAKPQDFLAELGFRPFKIVVDLQETDSSFDSANFGVRLNTKPENYFLSAGPGIVAPGQEVRLLAEVDTSTNNRFTGDVDFRDSVIQVNFYRESNGVPGLQSGGIDGDELILQDAERDDGFDVTYDTTGLPDGEQIFYTKAYDRGYFTTTKQISVDLVSGQTLPERPTDLRVLPVSTNNFVVQFIDNADDETGFLLQVSATPNFDVPEAIDNVYLPAGQQVDEDGNVTDETGVVSYIYSLPTDLVSANTTRYFRVRAYNTAGSTAFAGREQVRTLGTDEIFVDNVAEGFVNNGLTEVIDRNGNATNLTFFQGEGDFTLPLGVTGGANGEAQNFSLFVRNPNVELGDTLVEVIDGLGNVVGSTNITDVSRGADVLVGSFALDQGSSVRFTSGSGSVATVDAVRLIPTNTTGPGNSGSNSGGDDDGGDLTNT